MMTTSRLARLPMLPLLLCLVAALSVVPGAAAGDPSEPPNLAAKAKAFLDAPELREVGFGHPNEDGGLNFITWDAFEQGRICSVTYNFPTRAQQNSELVFHGCDPEATHTAWDGSPVFVKAAFDRLVAELRRNERVDSTKTLVLGNRIVLPVMFDDLVRDIERKKFCMVSRKHQALEFHLLHPHWKTFSLPVMAGLEGEAFDTLADALARHERVDSAKSLRLERNVLFPVMFELIQEVHPSKHPVVEICKPKLDDQKFPECFSLYFSTKERAYLAQTEIITKLVEESNRRGREGSSPSAGLQESQPQDSERPPPSSAEFDLVA